MKYRIFIFIFLLIASIVGMTYCFVSGMDVYGILLGASAVVVITLLVKEYRANAKKITYMLNALENNDSAFRFAERSGDSYNRLFTSTLNRINEILANEKMTTRENEKYFELLMTNVITGLITIDENGSVMNCNSKALELIGLPVFTHVSQLQRVDENLYSLLTDDTPIQESRTVSFFNESGEVNLSMRFSFITIRGKKLKIVSINDIGRELEEKEQDSWIRLIRVLTHEIMNTVTPISSLSETLSMMVNSSDVENDAVVKREVKNGLDVISTSSKGLISFVDSYRSMTRIPTPNKRAVYVKDLIHRVLTLMKDDFDKSVLVPQITYSDESIMIYADENLISQVLINLIKNALAAMVEETMGDGEEAVSERIPFIKVTIFLDPNNEDVIMDVSNNGKPISREDQEHIFVPFFTTKASGTGIGLSISRQIMRQHNGSLKLKCSNENETTFTLIFR